MRIRRIQPLPLAKISGVFNLVLGLVVGLIFSLVGLAVPAFGGAPAAQQMPGWSLFFGVGAIVFLPVLYGAFGFLSGLIGAAFYNALAKFVGGIVIEVE
jgi:hypothetical protein